MPILLPDSNFLERPDLETYLAANRTNYIGLSEHVMIESHKRDPVQTITKSFAIARKFPNQVLLLNSLPKCFSKEISSGDAARRLIDHKQSRHFAGWYDDVASESPPASVIAHLQSRQADAQGVIGSFERNASDLVTAFDTIKNRFTDKELREIRSHRVESDEVFSKLVQAMADITRSLFASADLGELGHAKSAYELRNYFLFRYSVCVMMMFIETSGDTPKSSVRRIVNDIVDLHLAAEATFFHGFLSGDVTANSVHRQARHFLRRCRAYVPSISR